MLRAAVASFRDLVVDAAERFLARFLLGAAREIRAAAILRGNEPRVFGHRDVGLLDLGRNAHGVRAQSEQKPPAEADALEVEETVEEMPAGCPADMDLARLDGLEFAEGVLAEKAVDLRLEHVGSGAGDGEAAVADGT